MMGGAAEVRERASRWLEEGQSQLNAVLEILNDYHRLRAAIEAAERECERLRSYFHENERLRHQLEAAQHLSRTLLDEISQLRSEVDRHVKEREDIAAALSQFMNEILLRLRGEQQA